MSSFVALSDKELLGVWDTVANHDERDLILAELQRRTLFPANFIKEWDEDTGAYPSTSDTEFLQKLMAKREFAELVQNEWKPDDKACSDTTTFEVTAVQTFVANLMSPRSPYLSALLYHGVGVGKTCAAVQIAEAWLSAYPKDRVYLVAPPTIQEGFYRTIFDITKMTVGEGPQNPNTQIGCTGNTYLELTGMTFEKDIQRINKRIRKTINRRYNIMGYVQFGNHVEKLLKGIDPELSEEERVQEEYRIINEEFSGKILIIDEAHNVRDITPDPEDEDPIGKEDPTGKKGAKSDMVAGKFMTPFLLKVLEYAQGLKLVLLTATPMYNSYKEIIFMLNLLLKNDKKATITMNMIFEKDTGKLLKKGEQLLGLIASRYVSFMRGENPASFPIRLDPAEGVPLLRNMSYPADTPRGNPVPKEELVYKDHLPIVPLELVGDAEIASILLTNELKDGDQGISGIELGSIIQAGNFIPPDPDGSVLTLESAKARLGPDGLDALFNKSKGPDIVYTSKVENGSTWLQKDNLSTYSPKFAFLLDQLATAKGVCFVYIRTVALGALPLALALEANGYTLAGRSVGLLGDGIQAPGGRQCALCDKKEKTHPKGGDHEFQKAYYGLITGNNSLTPNNTSTINLERQKGNEYGALMKVIIGSQIAGEGVDLRYIREVHILDTWYHLNRTEQIIGRAIRFCSHSALPKEQRNATIHLYASVFPDDDGRETGDLYSYRVAFRKAVQVGNVTRVLKIRAIDCNLNHDAIIIRNQKLITQIDSKGVERKGVNINDKPFTAICDWNDSCMYECKPKIKVDPKTADDSTYSEFAVKWRESKLKERFRTLFAKEVFYESAQLWNDLFGDVPEAARAELFESVIDNRAFQVTYKNGVHGYIKYCNGYYVFQPNVYLDLHIPMAIRAASFPVKRDFFEPKRYAAAEEAVVEETAPINLVQIWGTIKDWVGEFQHMEVDDKISIPAPIQERIEAMSSTEGDVIKKYNDIIDTIDWFRISILKAGGTDFDKFNNAVLEYIWDTWFTMKEQIELVEKSPVNTNPMVTGMSTTVGETRVYRYYNPKDASIEYICKNKPCSAIIKENVIGKEKDIPKKFLAQGDEYGTGQCYGFLTSDMGVLQFKINQRIKPNEKKALGGVMCKVISSIRGTHHTQLTDLGQILKDAKKDPLDLEYKTISSGPRKIENAIRACTLLELVLRYMDHSKIGRVRWFFRPIEARLIGYKGRFKAGTRSAVPKKDNVTAVATVATVATVAAKPKRKAKAKAGVEEEAKPTEE